MSPQPAEHLPPDTQAADDLGAILDHYDPEIATLFGQVLTLYAGISAHSLDDKQKKERLRNKLEESVQP
jgi:hypothetical protein